MLMIKGVKPRQDMGPVLPAHIGSGIGVNKTSRILTRLIVASCDMGKGPSSLILVNVLFSLLLQRRKNVLWLSDVAPRDGWASAHRIDVHWTLIDLLSSLIEGTSQALGKMLSQIWLATSADSPAGCK